MSEDTFNPTKPAWDHRIDGEHPTLIDREAHKKTLARHEELMAMPVEERLAVIDAKAEEARALADSPAQGEMTAEQEFLSQWGTHARAAAASLHVFNSTTNVVEERERKIVEQQRMFATALYKLGEIGAALAVAAAFPDLLEKIKWIRVAIDHDDDLTHDCPRPLRTTEHKGKEVEIELDRRYDAETVFSQRHGKLVHCWTCTECGEANATVETPERHLVFTSAQHTAIDKVFKHPKFKEGQLAAIEAGATLAKV